MSDRLIIGGFAIAVISMIGSGLLYVIMHAHQIRQWLWAELVSIMAMPIWSIILYVGLVVGMILIISGVLLTLAAVAVEK